MRGKILIADDEQGIVSFIKDYFETEGFEVLTAGNGTEAVEYSCECPDIILLDIMMPEMDGIEVCRAIRERVDCPILFLTARIEDSDKILGFGVGADDYVVKPFSIDELGARVEAHIRREKRKLYRTEHKAYGRLSIDFGQREVRYDQHIIPFARKEYEIMELLSLHPGQVFSRQIVYERVWGYDAEGDDNAVTEHIKRIRAKIGAYTEEVFIETVWGVGYKWLRK
ncbi:response regulator transcription factor [Bacillus sp. 03113]|uniref:response regulator transcription factor n=1 Tax=Bacillus sp. 03113 TaxID=2578211 RepID=UPI001144BD56|nr:response regulator transcription factor [Bacillus sp. 03113]